MAFNSGTPLIENIRYGLWSGGKTLKQMADDLDTTVPSIRTVVAERFRRRGKVPPLHRKITEYLLANCHGFREWAEAEGIVNDN